MTASKDHVARAMGEVTPPLCRPKMLAGVAAKIRPLQTLEDLIWDILDVLSIDAGYGIILDRIGRIVGRGRNGLSDNLYCVLLRVQILVNRSNGTVPEILEILRTAVNDSAWSFRASSGGMAIEIQGFGPYVEGMTEVLWSAIRKAKAGGVRIDYTGDFGSTFVEGHDFLFAQDWDPDSYGEPSDDHGMADDSDPDIDENGIIGGSLASDYAA